MAGGNDDPGARLQMADGEGELRRRTQLREDIGLDSIAREDEGGLQREVREKWRESYAIATDGEEEEPFKYWASP